MFEIHIANLTWLESLQMKNQQNTCTLTINKYCVLNREQLMQNLLFFQVLQLKSLTNVTGVCGLFYLVVNMTVKIFTYVQGVYL